MIIVLLMVIAVIAYVGYMVYSLGVSINDALDDIPFWIPGVDSEPSPSDLFEDTTTTTTTTTLPEMGPFPPDEVECLDTDYGLDILTPGYVDSQMTLSPDVCLSPSVIKEYECDTYVGAVHEVFDCPFGTMCTQLDVNGVPASACVEQHMPCGAIFNPTPDTCSSGLCDNGEECVYIPANLIQPPGCACLD